MKRILWVATVLLAGGAAAWGQAGNFSTVAVTNNSANALVVQGSSSNSAGMQIGNGTGNGSFSLFSSGGGPSAPGSFGIWDNNAGLRLLILSNGNVGIGTSPNYKLDVAGSIAATDIYVTSNALPDYVFDADYRNAPLPEVAKYIDGNRHLPGMPSAADAEKNRLSVGEMQNKLLEKVEELTLHTIAAEKRNNKLEQQNRELQERFARLEARSGEIEGQRNGAGK